MNTHRNPLSRIITISILFLLLFGIFAYAGGSQEVKDEKVRLTVGFRDGEALDSLAVDMAWKTSYMGLEFWHIVYNQLWGIGPSPDYDPVPLLATSWETEDHITWIFHLDEDAVWQDGTPVTADDVGFSLYYLPKAIPATYLGPGTDVASWEAIDDKTVKIVLNAAVNDGKYPIPLWTPILPKHIFEPYKDTFSDYPNEAPVGNGPFKVKEFAPSEYLWLEADENYWGEKAGVDEIVFQTFGSDDALYAALKSGEIDMITSTGASPQIAADLDKDPNISVIRSPGLNNLWISFNTYSATPLADKDFRKAFMYSIDKDNIIDLVYMGYAEKANSFIYPEMDTYNDQIPVYDNDLDKAAALLDTAGYTDTDGDGLRNDPATGENVNIELMVSSSATADVKMASLIKENLLRSGIEVTVKAVDLATYWEFIVSAKSDGYQAAIAYGDPGPNGNWVWNYADSQTGWNTAAYANPEYDEILAKMISAPDYETQKAYIKQLQAILAEDLPYGLLVRPESLDPVRTDRLEGWVQSMGGLTSYINPWTFSSVHPK